MRLHWLVRRRGSSTPHNGLDSGAGSSPTSQPSHDGSGPRMAKISTSEERYLAPV